ncbi:hypothetical protein AVEN_102013-1 [Araneus ventricosus]|uniref:Uncharacterized protein n=1 Tax=Araneus ventricosus TaxID=182803 RepID=A0A4Y2J260_ARAVE|nr:hypothetical protein AVEN_102013-1 [Araneus ventricosus]
MTAGNVRIVRKLPPSPSTSARATLTKKARAVGVKSITLYERGWKFRSDIRTFRTATVFRMKGRMERSRIDRVKVEQVHIHGGSSMESGFEPGTLRLRSRDFTIR